MAKKSETDSALELVIGVILFIPIAAFLLLRWLFHGIVWLFTETEEQKKPAAGKQSVPALQSGLRPGSIQQKSMEAPDSETDDDFELCGEEEDPQIQSGDTGRTQAAEPEDMISGKDASGMATIIGAGKYVFGEDLPMGKYDLKVVSGDGSLTIRYGDTEDDEIWMNMGTDADCAQEYRNLSLEPGYYFMLDDSLRVQISKSRMLEIDP